MNRTFLTLLLIGRLAAFLFSCEEEMTKQEIAQIGMTPCKSTAPFVQRTGLNPRYSGFSTSESAIKGLVLVQFPLNPQDTAGKRTWQDPSWQQYGWMGSITTDKVGNAYTAPLPKVNTLDNPLSKMNRIYKVDANTGKMDVFTVLPAADTSNGVVSFAVLGVYYDCHGDKIYASTVAGSTRDEERGVIYVIDPKDGKIVDEWEAGDAMGLFVGGATGEKRLYYGSARTSDVYSIELSKAGEFRGKSRKELSLDQLGPRGDDKARRIRLDARGNLLVFGVEFNYSLAAQSNKPETIYKFGYNQNEKKWEHIPNQ